MLIIIHYFLTPNPETLYDFRVDIKQSSIPNSGHGAFFTYLGARVLKPEVMKRTARLMENHIIHISPTHDPLTAVTFDGRRMDVKLMGESLHYNDNSVYWTKPRLKKFQAEESRRASMEGYDDDVIDCNVYKEVKKLKKRIKDDDRVGFLGINKESDYM